jgi:hypothetical protein
MRSSGTIGQEIIDPDGKIIFWTTDPREARLIYLLLNVNEELYHKEHLLE